MTWCDAVSGPPQNPRRKNERDAVHRQRGKEGRWRRVPEVVRDELEASRDEHWIDKPAELDPRRDARTAAATATADTASTTVVMLASTPASTGSPATSGASHHTAIPPLPTRSTTASMNREMLARSGGGTPAGAVSDTLGGMARHTAATTTVATCAAVTGSHGPAVNHTSRRPDERARYGRHRESQHGGLQRPLRLGHAPAENGGHHGEPAAPRHERRAAQDCTAADEQQRHGQRAEEDDVRARVGPSSENLECGGVTGGGTEETETTERQRGRGWTRRSRRSTRRAVRSPRRTASGARRMAGCADCRRACARPPTPHTPP